MTLATAITHVVKYSGVSVICPTLDLDSLAVQLIVMHCVPKSLNSASYWSVNKLMLISLLHLLLA